MKTKIFIILIVLISLGIGGFYIYKNIFMSEEEEITVLSEEEEQMHPCSWVFKTKGDYYNLVYGFVYDDRSKFATLPSSNLIVRPDKLKQEYFSISRGCSPDYLNYPYANPHNFVFCNITYEEWAEIRMGELEVGKSWDDFLIPLIIDEPFEEFYFCGEDSPFLGVLSIEELNEIIDNNELSTRCEKIEKEK